MESNNWILALAAGAALVGVSIYLLRKRRKTIDVETVDTLTLYYVKNYFKNNYKPIVETTPNIVPVLLKSDGKTFNDNSTEYSYYILTYYNRDTEEILENDTKYIRAKKLDTNLTDAFGDKDMLILS